MSRNVDERIVEMRFENEQFESGVDKTLSTLDKLEQKLQFKGSESGMENLEAKARNFDMSAMGTAAETVSRKFSALEVAGITAIASIVNSATNAAITIGKNLFSKYFVKPVSDGFQEYELIQNTIQSIYTNTKNKGTTIDEIESGLDDLNKYADQTIYVMSDMTKAIGQFTNAGVNFADSKKAVIGFSNLAAAVGATNEQLSRVEYQSSQAIASGVFRLMDWNSIQNSPLGGEYFQKALIKNAKEFYSELDSTAIEALGLDKETVDTVLAGLDDMEKGAISFRQSLSKEKGMSFYSDWLRSDVFMKTLESFADDPDLYEAATSVRTFTKMRETLEEAAGSGWAQTWKLIVGDFGESKALWTDVSKTLSSIIDGVGDARNKIVEFWKDVGGRDDIIQGLKNSMEAITRILKPIKEAFDETLGPFLEEYLVRISDKFEKFTGKLLIGEETANGIKNVFKVIFTLGEVILTIFEKIGSFLSNLGLLGGKLVGDIFQIIGKLTGDGGKLSSLWQKISGFLEKHGIKIPTDGLEKFGTSVDETGEKTDALKDKLTLKEGLTFSAGKFGETINKYFGDGSVFSKIKESFGNIGDTFSKMGLKIKEFFKNQDFITKEKLTGFFDKIVDIGKQIPGAVEKGWNKLNEVWTNLKASPEFQNLADSLKELGSSIAEVASILGKGAIDAFNKFLDGLKDPEKRAEKIESFSKALDTLASAMKTLAEIASPAINGIKELFDKIGLNLKDSDTKKIEDTAEAVNELAEATDVLNDNSAKKSDSLVTLFGSTKEFDDSKEQANKWRDFYNEFVEAHGGKGIYTDKEPSIFEKIFGEDNKYLKKTLIGGGFLASLALIIGTYRTLSKTAKKAGGMFDAIKSIAEKGVDIFGLKAFSKALNAKDKAKRFREFALGISLVVASISLIIYSIKDLDDPSVVWKAVAIVAGVALAISAMVAVLGKLRLPSLDAVSKNVLAIGVAIGIITSSIALLGHLIDKAEDPTSYAIAITTIFGVLIAFETMCVVLAKASSKNSKISDDFWKDFLGIATGIYIVSRAIAKLADEDPAKLATAAVVIGALTSLIAISIYGLSNIKLPNPLIFRTLGSMMISLAASLLLVIGAIGILGKMKPETLSQGAIAVGGIITVFGLIVVAVSKLDFSSKDISNLRNIGVAALLFAVAADLLVPAITAVSALAAINMSATITAILGLAGLFSVMMVAMSAAANLASADGNTHDVIEVAAALVLFSVSANLVASSLGKLTKSISKDSASFGKAIGAIAGILGLFTVLSAIIAVVPEAAVVPPVLIGISAAIAVFAAAVLLLSVAAKNFGTAIDKFADGIHKIATLTGRDIEQIKNNIIKFAQNSNDVWIAIAASFVAGVKVFYDAFNEVKPIIEEVISWFFDSIVGNITNKMDGSGQKIGYSLGRMLLTALQGAVAFLGANVAPILDLLDAVVVLVERVLVEAAIKFLGFLNMISEMTIGISPFDGLISKLSEFSQFLGDEINKLTNFDFSAAQDNLKNGISGLLDPFSLFGGEGSVSAPPFFDFSQPDDQASEFGESVPGTVAAGVLSFSTSELNPAGRQMSTDTADGANQNTSVFNTVGGNMVSGLVARLYRGVQAAYNAGFALGKAAAQGTKDGAKTASPSKETIWVAEMMNEGLVATLTSCIPEARTTGYLYASSVISGIKDASDFSNIYSPSITPVLRSGTVTKQMSDMTRALNMTRSMSIATTTQLASRDAFVMRNAAKDMKAMSMYDDSKVISNIHSLNDNINKLGTSIKGMGMYIDGKKAGRILTPSINKNLYTDSVRKGRNN